MEPQQDSESEVMKLSGLLSINEDEIDTEDEFVDPSFDLDNSVRNDYDHLVERFVKTGHWNLTEMTRWH